MHVGVIARLLGRDDALVHRLLDPGMVDRKLLDRRPAHQVQARVAHIAGIQTPVHHPDTDTGRPHPLFIVIFFRQGNDRLVGGVHGDGNRLHRCRTIAICDSLADMVDHHLCGHFTGLVSPNPVSDNGKEYRRGIILAELVG